MSSRWRWHLHRGRGRAGVGTVDLFCRRDKGSRFWWRLNGVCTELHLGFVRTLLLYAAGTLATMNHGSSLEDSNMSVDNAAASETSGPGKVRRALADACPGIRITDIRRLHAGYTSKQWIANTDEGPLLVKVPLRDKSPEHLRRLIATTRRAAEKGVPVVRFRGFVAESAVFGAPVLIQEYQDGTPADEAWHAMDTATRIRFAHELGQLVGQLHAGSGPWYGDVLGGEQHADIRTFLHTLIDSRLAEAPEDLTSVGRVALSTLIHRAVEAVPEDAVPALTHGDLWRPNMILRHGRIACLLDFEHGGYADRFLDFGKLDEHIFKEFPEGRAVFLNSYRELSPLPDDWEERVRLAHAIHALSMSVYFLRWTPKFAPEYVGDLEEWLATQR
jgi:aminoglycoside phosphotransferase (APT) family kinase protein